MRLRTVINYQWSRHRGTHHVIGLHQDSCITHSSLYSHLRNRYVADQCTWKLLFVYNLKHSVEAKFDQSDTSWMHIPCDAYVSAWALQIYEARKITSMNECSTLFISTPSSWNQQNQLTIHCKIENPYSLKLWDELTLILLLWSTFDHTWCLLLWWSMLFICSKSRWRSNMIRL